MESCILTFLTVCEEMNFTRAALRLHMTQPAVSQQIHRLEERYRAPLFFRDGRRISLTPAGCLLQNAARTAQNDEKVLQKKMAAVNGATQLLCFGATRTLGEFGLEPEFCLYVKSHPELETHLIVDNTENLLEDVKCGRLQCAFIEGSFDPQKFDFAVLRTEDYFAVCAARHIFPHKPLTVHDLTGETLLVREPGSGTREIMEQYLAFQNVAITNFKRIVQVGSMHVILNLLKQDAGISFMYRMAARRGMRDGTLRSIPLAGLPICHSLSLVWNRGSRYADEYRALCREFKGHGSE